jgi:hypothetical protein
MMPGTAGEDAAPEAGCGHLRHRADALLDQFAALMADVAADPDRPDLARRMALLTAAFREDRAELAGHVFADSYADAIEARAEQRGFERGRAAERAAAAVPAQRRARPASPSQRSFFPRLVQGAVPIGGIGAVLRASRGALRHPWIAHHAAALGAGATGVTAATVLVASTALTGSPLPGIPSSGGASGTPAPAASIYSATPMYLPSLPPAAALAGRPKLDASSSRREALADLATRPPTTPAPAPAPAASGTAAQQSPASSPLPAAGTLQADTTAVDLGTLYAGQVTLTAVGGPVSWGAVPSSAKVVLSATQGTLAAGGSFTLGISVSAAAQLNAGTATVHIYPGIVIEVTWLAAPPPPAAASSPVLPVSPSVSGS